MASKVKSQSADFVYAKDIEAEDVGGGITRQILGYGPDLMIVRVWFKEGSVGDVHDHVHSQSTYVESGVFRVEINGKQEVLRAGDSFYIESHAKHGAVCLKEGVLLDTFSPAREDFLSERE